MGPNGFLLEATTVEHRLRIESLQRAQVPTWWRRTAGCPGWRVPWTDDSASPSGHSPTVRSAPLFGVPGWPGPPRMERTVSGSTFQAGPARPGSCPGADPSGLECPGPPEPDPTACPERSWQVLAGWLHPCSPQDSSVSWRHRRLSGGWGWAYSWRWAWERPGPVRPSVHFRPCWDPGWLPVRWRFGHPGSGDQEVAPGMGRCWSEPLILPPVPASHPAGLRFVKGLLPAIPCIGERASNPGLDPGTRIRADTQSTADRWTHRWSASSRPGHMSSRSGSGSRPVEPARR